MPPATRRLPGRLMPSMSWVAFWGRCSPVMFCCRRSSERYAIDPAQPAFFRLLPPPSQVPIPGGNNWAGDWRLAAALMASLFLVWDFETMLLRTQKNTVIRRDYAATVISFGEGRNKRLLVNGIGMTILTPDHQIHGPSADGFSPGPARIGADHLFWHGHKLSFGVELEH